MSTDRTTEKGSFQEQWEASVRARYAQDLAAGRHDHNCERRERYGLCGCRWRKRAATGPHEPPVLLYAAPICGGCYEETYHDGDGWRCERCHVGWDSNGYDEPGEFDDNDPSALGESTAERYGERLIVLVTEPSNPPEQTPCPEVLADRDGNCTACGKPILSPGLTGGGTDG